MSPVMRVLSWALLSTGVFAVSANASNPDEFVICTRPDAVVEDTLARHGLRMVRKGGDPARPMFVVEKVTALATADLQAEVAADDTVGVFEQLRDVNVPEALDGAALNQSTAALLDALAGKTFVSLFGDPVWNRYVNQPAATIVGVPAARLLATGAGVVAIIDTGVDPNHPALRRVLVPGFDFTRDVAGSASEWADLDQSTAALLDQSTAALLDQSTAALLDQVVVANPSTLITLNQSTAALLDTAALPRAFGHGTMVAGIVHLVAPNAQIMPLKAFSADGSSNTFDIIRAIYYAVDHGAKVINMSFSFTEGSGELMKAINYAAENRVICVSSVGNSGLQAPLVYPAAIRSVIAVASLASPSARSVFSNHGNALVHVAAPGEGVITSYPGGRYAAAWGTSFSAPFVAGAGALLIQVNGSTTPLGASDDISDAVPLGPGLGHGRLDLVEAIRHGMPGSGKP